MIPQRYSNGRAAMPRWPGMRLGILLATGLTGVVWAQSPSNFDGQYVGELTLTRVRQGDCTSPPLGAIYPLTISRGEVHFAYIPLFATTLNGRIAPDGAFKATARLRHGIIEMTGQVQGSEVTANLVSPSCVYTFRTRS
jgi:hypothetical protein